MWITKQALEKKKKTHLQKWVMRRLWACNAHMDIQCMKRECMYACTDYDLLIMYKCVKFCEINIQPKLKYFHSTYQKITCEITTTLSWGQWVIVAIHSVHSPSDKTSYCKFSQWKGCKVGCWNRPVSQMRAPSGGLSRTSRKLWQDYSELLYVLNIKPYIF